jgi:hypothetical protein
MMHSDTVMAEAVQLRERLVAQGGNRRKQMEEITSQIKGTDR